MIIQLDFTEQEMIRFLENCEYQCYKEDREFDTDSIFEKESSTEMKSVIIVIDYNADEITVPVEEDFRMKSAVLQETFTKEFKKHLLTSINNK